MHIKRLIIMRRERSKKKKKEETVAGRVGEESKKFRDNYSTFGL